MTDSRLPHPGALSWGSVTGLQASEAMGMPFITLDCGRQVYLDAFDYSRTYGGLLEGRPNPDINNRIIERGLSARETSWGRRKTHLIRPILDTSDPAHPTLPPVLLRAWLWCDNPLNPAFMGSELVVVWFAEECHDEPIAKVVFQAVRGLAWHQLAEDFNW